MCMESSVDDNILFLGGSSNYNLTEGVAKVFALTFDEDMDFIRDLILPNNVVHTVAVSDIKRLPNIDVLICGTKAAVFVVEWTGSHFEILSQVEQIHSCKLFFFTLQILD